MKKLFLAITVVAASACVQKAKQAPPIKVGQKTQKVRQLTKTEFERWKLVEMMEFNEALTPVWTDTVKQQNDRERACKDALELDEYATDLARAELPKELKNDRATFDESVGELRAAIIIFAAECQEQEEARPWVASFESIPQAFESVKSVVGVDEAPAVSASVAPSEPSPVDPGGR
ncbi:MAG: hypothetical protein AAFY60_17410 [Myxococcota bacterium]